MTRTASLVIRVRNEAHPFHPIRSSLSVRISPCEGTT
jgi:hypothetical protein